ALFKDAENMLKRIVNEHWLQARAVVGLWPANAREDDVVLYMDEKRAATRAVFHTLRQQTAHERDVADLALADFIAPESSGKADYLGGFVVSTGFGEEKRSERFKAEKDDYNSILLKALADRLAESFAERMHQRVRAEFWAYAPEENLSNAEL